MTTNTKTRQQLKAYFVRNAIPTQGNFEDLIDAPLNQRDDGVFKQPGEPLGVVAAPGPQRRALRFYAPDAQEPDWIVSLSPAQNPADPATARPGLGLTNSTGLPRLFLDLATGHLSLGTNDPGPSRLHVEGNARVTGGLQVAGAPGLTVTGSLSVAGSTSLAGLTVSGPATLAALSAASLSVAGAASLGSLALSGTLTAASNLFVTAGNVGIGTNNPGANRLQVEGPTRIGGLLTASAGLTVTGATTLAALNAGTTALGTLTASGSTSLVALSTSGPVTVGTAQAPQTLAVTGATTLAALSTSGAVTIGTAQAPQNLAVTGTTALAALSTAGAVAVGTAQAPQNLAVTGTTTLAALSASGVVTAGSNLLVPAGNVAVGAASPGTSRLHVEGLTRINGNLGLGSDPGASRLHVEGSARVTGTLTVSGGVLADGGLNVAGPSTIAFGAPLRQLINLAGVSTGIGVQTNTLYLRSSTHFALYQGGTHADTELTPGAGGSAVLVVSSGNVGIGTATPSARLQVSGNASVSGGLSAGSLSLSGNALVSGLLGVGTNTPQVPLDVAGNARVTGSFSAGSLSAGATALSGRLTASAGLVVSGGLALAGPLSAPGDQPIHFQAAADDHRTLLRLHPDGPDDRESDWIVTLSADFESEGELSKVPGLCFTAPDGVPRLFIDQAGGNVGIGTTNLHQRLVVAGGAAFEGPIFASQVYSNDLLQVAGPATFGSTLQFQGANRQMVHLQGTLFGLGVQSNTLYLRSGRNFALYQGGVHDNTDLSAGAGGVPVLVVSNGNVGVGTTNPSARLHVSGAASVTGLVSASGGLNVSGGALVVPSNALGIGTTNPQASLDVQGNARVRDNLTLDPGVLNLTGTSRQMIHLGGASNGLGLQSSAAYLRYNSAFALFRGGAHSGTDLDPGAGGALTLVANSSGNVAIGAASPGTNRLHVEGNTQVSGNAQITGNIVVTGTATAAGGVIIPPLVGRVYTGRTGVQLRANQQQHVALPTFGAGVDFASGITIQAWVYPTTLGEFARIVELGNGLSRDNILFFIGADASLGCAVYQGTSAGVLWNQRTPVSVTTGGAPASFPGHLPQLTWTHVAMTVTPGVGLRFYLNGAPVHPSPLPILGPQNLARTVNYIGRSSWGNDPYFDGSIAEVAIFTGTQPIRTGPLAGNESGLVGYWRLDQSATASVAPTGTTALGGLSQPGFGTSLDYSEWRVAPTQGGWGRYSTNEYEVPGYYKDPNGFVHLRGLLARGQDNVNLNAWPGEPLFVLPCGFRPENRCIFTTISNTTTTTGRIDVAPNGLVSIVYGNTAWISLDGLSFRAHH